MAVLTRKIVFAAVRAKYATAPQRQALTQRLGQPWHHASTEKLAQLVGLRGTPRKTQGAGRAKAIAKQHGIARSFAAEQTANRMTDDGLKRSQIKARIVRSVKRELDATKKRLGRNLELKEKRAIAAKALSAEVKAIKAGVPEAKGRKKPQLTAITGGGRKSIDKMHLQELFGEADRIGGKYADGTTSLEAARKARQILSESGYDAVMAKGRGRSPLTVLPGGQPPSPEVARRPNKILTDAQDNIPFGYDTTARRPPAKRLDGKLNKQQQQALSAHLHRVASGSAKTIPLRAFQDQQGEHWLEMRGKTGKIGAVPLNEYGKQDNSRAVHSEDWETKRKGMKTISVFPEGRGMVRQEREAAEAQKLDQWLERKSQVKTPNYTAVDQMSEDDRRKELAQIQTRIDSAGSQLAVSSPRWKPEPQHVYDRRKELEASLGKKHKSPYPEDHPANMADRFGMSLEGHKNRVEKALDSGRMSPDRAKELGHFDAYPDLAQKYRKKTAPQPRAKATTVPKDDRDWKLPETPKSMRVNGRNID